MLPQHPFRLAKLPAGTFKLKLKNPLACKHMPQITACRVTSKYKFLIRLPQQPCYQQSPLPHSAYMPYELLR